MFEGAITALATPFRNGQVDEDALRQLVDEQIKAGIDALVPCGTTGESPTLSPAEQGQVVAAVVAEAKGRVPIIAGAGANATEHAATLARQARERGADGLLVVTPYYNRPTQDGLVSHFGAVIKDGRLPTVLYNVPSRTACDLLPSTVARLCELPEVVAIKEATGSVARAQDLVGSLGDRLTVLSGDDVTSFPLMAVGAKGVISVTANVSPAKLAGLWDAVKAGDWDRARALHYELLPLHQALFLEANPIPVKAALHLMGKFSGELRSPLTRLSVTHEETLRATLSRQGLLP